MDRPAGSYIEDENGNIVPNRDDEAMAARGLGVKPGQVKAKGQAKKEEDDHD